MNSLTKFFGYDVEMATETSRDKAALFTQLFEPKLSQGDQKILKIIDGAIECYAKSGVDGVTMDKIAKESGVSRPLVFHYFEDKREIFTLAVKRIRLNFQRVAIEAIQKASTPTAKLKAYVESTFDWVESFPSHIRVWLLYLYQCSTDRADLALNTELVNTGHDRIMALLREGIETGEFAKGPVEWRAKLIQLVISGALVSSVSEELRLPFQQLQKNTAAVCLNIAKSKN